MTPLLPERAGCPQCGSTEGRRWRSYSGIELCTDCEWDFLSDLNGRKLLDAEQAVMTRALSASVASRRGSHPRRLGVSSTTATHSASWVLKRNAGTVSAPKSVEYRAAWNSICRACGHIFYNAALSSCSRCGGLCEHRSDHDLTLMGRYAQRFIEAER